MRRMPRSRYDKGFFHVMVQGINKKYIFEKEETKEEYISLLNSYKDKYEISLLAYCVMDNHAHILIYTSKISLMSDYMKTVNSKFARNFNEKNDRVGYVFRDRFNSQFIDSDDYLLKCLHYIHMNPVAAGIVCNPKDYKFSTYNEYISGRMQIQDIEKILGKRNNYLSVIHKDLDIEIEIMDVDREEKNLEIAVNSYLKETNKNIDQIKNDSQALKKFCKYIIFEKKYKQNQLSNLLNIDKSKIYYIMKKIKKDSTEDRIMVE